MSTHHTETLGIVLPFHRNHNLSLPFILTQKFFLRDFKGRNHEKESHLSISGLSDILFAQPVNSFNLIFKKKIIVVLMWSIFSAFSHSSMHSISNKVAMLPYNSSRSNKIQASISVTLASNSLFNHITYGKVVQFVYI